jgi:murein DD-endopeptidase MepM/ murein hydrolase activator NlpD
VNVSYGPGGGGQATVAVGSTKLYGTYVSNGASDQGVKLGAGIGYPDLPFGAGGRPTTTGIDWSGSSWVCPTGRAKTGFGHSFIPKTPGATRYHSGIDMAARQGTPLLAVEDGVAMPKIMPLTGGMTVFVVTSSGKMYYYAHLEAWGKMGRVSKGTIIGYAGMTGRAGGPHLHFQYHPGGIGSAAVDPYDLLKAHC